MSRVITVEASRVLGLGYLHQMPDGTIIFEGIGAEQMQALRDAVGDALCSEQNPTGVEFYYDTGVFTPYRIADDQMSQSFAMYTELLDAAKKWNDR